MGVVQYLEQYFSETKWFEIIVETCSGRSPPFDDSEWRVFLPQTIVLELFEVFPVRSLREDSRSVSNGTIVDLRST